jgi:hemolysin activation/secretion protein
VPAGAQTVSQLDQAIGGQTTILQRFTPPPRVGMVDITVEDQRRRLPDVEAGRVRFRLRSLTVDGAETLPSNVLAAEWRNRIGTEMTVAELYRIADAIDAAYVRAGYFSMTVVPVQDFASGDIHLRLYESYVATVEINSRVPDIERRLKPYIDRIVAMRPIRIKEAERILGLMSDLGGLEIEGTFYKPDMPTGGGRLVLKVGFDRGSGMVGLDNLGTEAVGPLELSGHYTLNDVLGFFETTNIVAVTVPDSPKEMALLQLSQDYPIGHHGVAAGYSFSYVAQQPGGSLKSLDIDIETRIGSAYLRYPFIRTLDRNLFGQIEINARNDHVDMGGDPLQRSRTRWLLASLSYDRDFATSSFAGSVSLGQGLDQERDDRDDDFRYLAGDLDYTRPIGEANTLRLRAAGQYAAEAIPSAVQFSLGGDPYGWAFDGSTLSGDSGVAGAIELSRPVETRIAALGTVSITALADYGVIWNHDVAADYTRDTLGSVGLGVSGMLNERLSFQIVAAVPWDTGDTVEDPGPGVFFRIGLPI